MTVRTAEPTYRSQAGRRTARPKAAATRPAPAVGSERVTVKLPGGFDPDRHRAMLQYRIVSK